jgi:hypothetical protein
MNFFEWLTTRRKTLATMNAAELRAQEMLLDNERNRMQAKIRQLAGEKQKIIEQVRRRRRRRCGARSPSNSTCCTPSR